MKQNSWFLDDGFLGGNLGALRAAWDILSVSDPPRGLFLSRVKSLERCPGHDITDRDPLQRGITRAEDRGSKVLGAPIGDHDFEEEVLESRLKSVVSLLDLLPVIPVVPAVPLPRLLGSS